MSIVIKGIDMPKDTKSLMIVWYDQDDYDTVSNEIKADKVIRIPTPHGRLIDADALELEKEVELADDWKTAHEIANCVKYAPTILEAEE